MRQRFYCLDSSRQRIKVSFLLTGYVRPEKDELIIYELLIRDFLNMHDYSTLVDTLSYLARLGVTAIELMPVNEFEGNKSWGYNPSFHMALDKYYGPAEDFKALSHAGRMGIVHALKDGPVCA